MDLEALAGSTIYWNTGTFDPPTNYGTSNKINLTFTRQNQQFDHVKDSLYMYIHTLLPPLYASVAACYDGIISLLFTAGGNSAGKETFYASHTGRIYFEH